MVAIPSSQTIKPNLDFSGSGNPAQGYIANQHENDNFIRKNALNADKFNEYERLLYNITLSIGNLGSSVFTNNGGKVGETVSAVDSRLKDLESLSSPDKPATSYHMWLMGGNTFFDRDYSKGTNPESLAHGHEASITSFAAPDYQVQVLAGTTMIGTEKINAKFNEVATSQVVDIKRSESKITADVDPSLSDGESNYPKASGEQHTIGNTTDSFFLNNRYIKTGTFTGVSNAAILIRLDAGSSYTDISGAVTIDHETGEVTLSAGFKAALPSSTTVGVYYGHYQYRKDLVYIDSNDPVEPVKVYRGVSKNTYEEIISSNEFTENIESPGGILNIDPFDPTFKQAQLLIYTIHIMPWNALDEAASGSFPYQELSVENNFIDYRVDSTQSISKWKTFRNSVIDLVGEGGIEPNYENNAQYGSSAINVLPHVCLADGHIVKTLENTLDPIATYGTSISDRVIAICFDHLGYVNLSEVSSGNEYDPIDIPSILQNSSEDRDGDTFPDGNTYDYIGYLGFIFIPANAQYFEEFTIVTHKTIIDVPTVTVDNYKLLVSLYRAGLIDAPNLSPIVEDLRTNYLVAELTGEYGRYYRSISLSNYVKLQYPQGVGPVTSIPSRIRTIVADSIGVAYLNSYSSTVNIQAGMVLDIQSNLSIIGNLALNEGVIVNGNNKSIVFTDPNGVLKITGDNVVVRSLKIDVASQASTEPSVVSISSSNNLELNFTISNWANKTSAIGIDNSDYIAMNLVTDNPGGTPVAIDGNSNTDILEVIGNFYGSIANVTGAYSFHGFQDGTSKKIISVPDGYNHSTVGTLAHSGTTNLTGGTTTISTLSVTGVATINTANITTLSISGATTFNGTVRFNENAIVSSSKYLQFDSGAHIKSNDNNIDIVRSDNSAMVAVRGDQNTEGTATGSLSAGKVYNAVWNDVADYQKIAPHTQKIPGRAYYQTENGLRLCDSIYTKKASVGIYSDTFGFGVGVGTKSTIPVAIAGWVLAYVDKIYPPGTPLVVGSTGYLTKASLIDRLFNPHLILGSFSRIEPLEEWGPERHKIKVSGRSWIKVK